MTQCEKLVDFFRANGYQATLSQLIEAGFYKLTARVSDLRKKGYRITVNADHLNPGRNIYTMFEPITAPTWRIEPNGQTAFA